MADVSIHDSTGSPPNDGFGTHALAPWREALRSFGAGLIPRRYGLLGSIVNWPIWRLSLVGRPGPVDLEPYPGFRLRLYPRENHADTKCYARPGLVELGEEACMARCAATSPDDRFIMVDVGANTGTYTVLAANLARRAGKSGRFLCIEANPKTQGRLAANLHFSGLEAQTDLIACAVSDRAGRVMLAQSAWNLGSTSICDGAGKKMSQLTQVPARTLESLVKDAKLPRIDFLKIDIEGHEVQALEPFLRTASANMLPRMILAETKHDRNDQLACVLLGAGYHISHTGRSDTVFER